MAVSREDARNIGKEAADKVIKSAQGCHCGIAMWDARTNIQSLEAVIQFQRPDWLEPLPRFMESILTVIEQDCGTNMSKPKELTKRLVADIEKKDWQEARVNLALLRGSILGSLEECAEEKIEGAPVRRITHAPYIHETKRIGDKVIKKYSVATTDLIVYEVWEPSAIMGPHATITSIDNKWYGLIGTRKPSPELEALPPMSEERVRAVGKWYENQYEEAYRLIIQAFPEAKDGRRSAGVIFVHWSEI